MSSFDKYRLRLEFVLDDKQKEANIDDPFIK